MATLTKESIAESEVILNRTNIALARSRKLIQSWMPPADSTNDTNGTGEDDEEDEAFKPESETAGLGSVATQDQDLLGSGLPRSRSSGKDKLLEQILGKKGAREHVKKKPSAARTEPSKKTGSTDSTNNKRARQSDDEEEEESRTTMLSKRTFKRR